jgi:HEPN domain-containing protein
MSNSRKFDYMAWQNRAFRFYEAARLLHRNEMYKPAAYSATTAIELILKATLQYWHPQVDPEGHGHGIRPLTNEIKNKVPEAKTFSVPEYFYFEQRYLFTSRYPRSSKGIGVPPSFIDDLDQVFFSAVKLTPNQHRTELVETLSLSNTRRYRNVTVKNKQIREALKFLKIIPRKALKQTRDKPITNEQLMQLLGYD